MHLFILHLIFNSGVRVDQSKLTQWHSDLVRFTDNFPLEKLQRIYTSMAKVSLENGHKLLQVKYFIA